MRCLLTGHRGMVGVHVHEHLLAAGHEVIGLDVADGDDVCDGRTVRDRVDGCDSVVHAAAIAHDSRGTPEQIRSVNVDGTRTVLDAAGAVGARIVYFSSAQVFGIADGERAPDYLPIDDDHPRRAARAYGRSKCVGEDLCRAHAARFDVAVVALRPFLVLAPDGRRQLAERWQSDPATEWEPFWEFGAFVDVRDVCAAVAAALVRPQTGYDAVSLCSPDIAASRRTSELIGALLPDVEWRGALPIDDHGRRALVDTTRAREVLGWTALHTFELAMRSTSGEE